MTTAADFKQKDETAREANFATFMNQKMIRVMLSKLPSTEPELLEALLKEAHDRGWNAGSGNSAAMLIQAMMKEGR